jgi:hypothetical protein
MLYMMMFYPCMSPSHLLKTFFFFELFVTKVDIQAADATTGININR